MRAATFAKSMNGWAVVQQNPLRLLACVLSSRWCDRDGYDISTTRVHRIGNRGLV